LDGDQLHVGHGDKVAEIGGVVERVPAAYLDGGDADRHGVLFMDARFLAQQTPGCCKFPTSVIGLLTTGSLSSSDNRRI
jgi:hypothetical protein